MIQKKTHARNKPRRKTNGFAGSRKAHPRATDQQLTELINAYHRMGKLLENFVGRERLYQTQFLRGLRSALQDVSAGRTQKVDSFEDFVR